VFNLSSWTDKRQLLIDWLVFELSSKYQIPKKIGRAWLEKNRILPLLDGLDEVKAENRAACAEAINYFGETFGLLGRVICSRIKEYTTLLVRLKLNGAICLQPLTINQVNSYLLAGGDKLAALRTTLKRDEALQELAYSPLMLNIMSLAYQDLSIEDLAREALKTQDDHRKHLFNNYIRRMFLRKGKPDRPYPKAQTLHWLSWLAQKMTKHSQTVFLIESMQPGWLQTHWMRRLYTISFFVIIGLIIGLNVDAFWTIFT
jgi:predicted NACHT family NTPase